VRIASAAKGSTRQMIRQNPFDAFDERAVQRLAARFEVSVQALTIRLTRLRLIIA
jgi:Zn-dependent peptidase ImmA (M78 family)